MIWLRIVRITVVGSWGEAQGPPDAAPTIEEHPSSRVFPQELRIVSGAIIVSYGARIPEMSKTLSLAVATLLTMAVRISAHHAFAAEYDANRRVTVSGTVTRFEWTNPHVWLYVADEKDRSGALWSFEMGSPGGLTRRGWTKTTLKAGDHVTVEGFAAKDGTRKANAATVTTPGGKLFGGFQTTPGAPAK
jgi:uncharacterized protein DUF6152